MNIDLLDTLSRLEKYANQMREKPTYSEKLMMGVLKELKIEYVHQYIYGYYIADFYLPKYNKVIEVNGSSHIGKEAYDARRMNYFSNNGIEILNVRNEKVLMSKNKIMNFVLGKREAKLLRKKEKANKPKPPKPPKKNPFIKKKKKKKKLTTYQKALIYFSQKSL